MYNTFIVFSHFTKMNHLVLSQCTVKRRKMREDGLTVTRKSDERDDGEGEDDESDEGAGEGAAEKYD